MVKIKGWTLKTRSKDYIIWENIYPTSNRYILIVESIGGIWSIVRRNDEDLLIAYPIKTKRKAIKIAIDYMKNHPKG